MAKGVAGKRFTVCFASLKLTNPCSTRIAGAFGYGNVLHTVTKIVAFYLKAMLKSITNIIMLRQHSCREVIKIVIIHLIGVAARIVDYHACRGRGGSARSKKSILLNGITRAIVEIKPVTRCIIHIEGTFYHLGIAHGIDINGIRGIFKYGVRYTKWYIALGGGGFYSSFQIIKNTCVSCISIAYIKVGVKGFNSCSVAFFKSI